MVILSYFQKLSWTHSLQRSGSRKAAVDVNTLLRPHLRIGAEISSVEYLLLLLLSMTILIIGFTCPPSIDPFQVGNWKYDKCYYNMRHLFYYKVRQNRSEVTLQLSCEYLINLLRRRFQNYYTILRVINKTLFKTRVVLNY